MDIKKVISRTRAPAKFLKILFKVPNCSHLKVTKLVGDIMKNKVDVLTYPRSKLVNLVNDQLSGVTKIHFQK